MGQQEENGRLKEETGPSGYLRQSQTRQGKAGPPSETAARIKGLVGRDAAPGGKKGGFPVARKERTEALVLERGSTPPRGGERTTRQGN